MMMSNKAIKKLIWGLALFVLVSLLAACVRPGTTTTASGGGNGSGASQAATVHMNETNFVQPTITVNKGGSLALIDDVAVAHIIQNGTWNNGVAQPAKEGGAPTIQESFSGNDSHIVGPFSTAGTFKLYCTIHPNMSLTITVK